MKVRDSGMPPEAAWETFFDAAEVLTALSLDEPAADVVDFGCGYGTFALAAAKRTTGTVYALDIEAEMVEVTARRAASVGASNIHCVQRDFVTDGTGLESEAADYALLFNILHTENPLLLLREAFRVLRPNGRAAIIHWVHNRTTPRGPNLSIRPRSEQCRQWLEATGFEIEIAEVALPPYHYGVVGRKIVPR